LVFFGVRDLFAFGAGSPVALPLRGGVGLDVLFGHLAFSVSAAGLPH